MENMISIMIAGMREYQSLKESRDFAKGLARLEQDSKAMEAIGIKLIQKMREAIKAVRSLNDDSKLREWLRDSKTAEQSRLAFSEAIEGLDKTNMELILGYQPEIYSFILAELIEIIDSLKMTLEDPNSPDPLIDFSLN